MARGLCPTLRTQRPLNPARNSLTFQRKALPGLTFFFFFFFLGLNFPARSCVAKATRASTWPLAASPLPSPAVEGGAQSVFPRTGTEGEDVLCTCLLPWPKHCAIWQSEGAFAGCQEWGTKKENPGCLPAAAAAEAARAGPHLLAECRGNGRHRGPSSPRQSKQDRWARAWRD